MYNNYTKQGVSFTLKPEKLSLFFHCIFQVLFNQFKYFLNAFFLTLALTQFYPPRQVGYLYTYWAPLGFVIGVGLIREAAEDLVR